jgi:rubrerythrin
MAEDARKGRSSRLVRCPSCGALVGTNVADRHDDRCPFCGHQMGER